jgi:MFS superfamily sulfate permease-like transporter
VLVGVVLIALGLLRMGSVSGFIAAGVQVGFMFGLGADHHRRPAAQAAWLPPGEGTFFAQAADRWGDGIRDALGDADPPVTVVLLDLSFTPELDIESVNVLGSLRSELERQGRAYLYRDVEDAVTGG